MTLRRVLFVQATEPGAYPPIINAALLMADDGWEVTVLGAPVAGKRLLMPSHPRIRLEGVAPRPSHVMPKAAYAAYCAATASLARRTKPSLVYVSDPLGALPGLVAAAMRGSASRLVYHEHDSPSAEGDLNGLVRLARRLIARRADRVVFPNKHRADQAASHLECDRDKLAIVWNVPRRAEIPVARSSPRTPFIVYYHGSINEERLPATVARAVSLLPGPAILRIAGYETGRPGHVASLEHEFGRHDQGGIIHHIGQVPHRKDLLAEAAKAHVGLALMPRESTDINMLHMTGASNKAFDFMAAGLPLIVSDLPDWRSMFVEPGYGFAADPQSVDSLSQALGRLWRDQDLCAGIADRNLARILQDWNYDTQFAPILSFANDAA